jgi:hypothetical protein
MRDLGNFAGKAEDDVVTSADAMATKWKWSGAAIVRTLGDVADAFDETWSELAGTADQAAEDIFGPLERRAELAANKLAQGQAKGTIADPESSRQTVADARAELLGLQKDFFTLTAEMAGRGELTTGELGRLTDALRDQLKTATHEESVSILNLLGLLTRLRNAARGIFPVVPRTTGYAQGDRLPGQGGARAHGGPVSANMAYMVGEKGPELFVPNTGGAVIPNAGSGSPVGMGDTSAILNALNQQTAYLSRIAAGEPYAARPMTARGDLARQSALVGGRL